MLYVPVLAWGLVWEPRFRECVVRVEIVTCEKGTVSSVTPALSAESAFALVSPVFT